MTWYFILLLGAATPAIFARLTARGAWWQIFSIVIAIFVGLRYQVGPDWPSYIEILDYDSGRDIRDILTSSEPGYHILSWVSSSMGLGIYGVNFLTSAIFVFGLTKFCSTFDEKWMALASSIPFLVIVVAMSANRQAPAIGLELYLLSVWKSSGIIKRSLFIVLASTFHVSAIFLMIFAVLDLRLNLILKIIIASVASFAVYSGIADSTSFMRYSSSYVEHSDTFAAAGSLQQILVPGIPAIIIIIFWKTFSRMTDNWTVIRNLSLFLIILIPFNFAYSVAAARLSYYGFAVPIFFYANVVRCTRNTKLRKAIRLVTLFSFFVTLSLWIAFANHSTYYIPYENVLFN